METFIEAWNLICDYLKNQIPEVSYNLWIGKIEPVNLDFSSGSVVLKVPTPFHRDIIMKSYQNNLKEAFNNVLGSEFQIDILTEDQMELQEETKEETKKSDDYEFTFETFIVGPSNKFAHAAAMAVATKPAVLYNPLFIYGNSGLGKTHLLYAICNEIEKNNPNINIVYIKGDEFTNELIEAIRRGTTAEFRQKYRKSDVLLVDDIQFIAGKESTQEEFFHTFNALYDARKQIVLTSDRPPKEIKTLEDRLRSRFEQDLIADIQPPDLETRIAIIKRKAELDGVEISDEVCEYVASKIKANIRQLEGTVKKIKAKYYLDGEKPTINSVQGIISDILNNDAPPEVTVERIIDEVARTYGVSADEIRSQKNRSANISNARHIAIYVTRELTTLSMVAIGEEFGNRHYSTIIYTIQKVQKMMEKDRKVKEIIDDTIKNIRDR